MSKSIDYRNQEISLNRRLWGLAFPVMLSAALENFYEVVDMAWVGQISSAALSGVTLFSTIFFLGIVLNEIAGQSSVSLLSQSHGRGDAERTQMVAEQTIAFKVVLACLASGVLLLLFNPLLRFFTADPAIIQAARDYGYLRIFFLPVSFSSYSVNTIFRCTGDARTPLHIMVLATILNLVLDPLMIFKTVPVLGIPGFGLGVFGASVATVLSTCIAFLYGFFILTSGRRAVRVSFRGLFHLVPDIDRTLLTIGLPTGFESFLRQGFNIVLLRLIGKFGSAAIALVGIGGRFMGVMIMPVMGMMSGGSTLAGFAIGKGDIDEAKRVSHASAFFNSSMTIAASVLVWIFAAPIIRIFGDHPELLADGVAMLRILSLAIIIIAHGFGFAVCFSGSGYNKPFLYASIVSRWCVQVPLLILFYYILHLPLASIWWTYVFSEAAEWLVFFWQFKQGRWEGRRV